MRSTGRRLVGGLAAFPSRLYGETASADGDLAETASADGAGPHPPNHTVSHSVKSPWHALTRPLPWWVR